ncbi:Flp pilus assembly protein CpaB [Arthrobacter oryzae]|uniref:Flp pilus assembly protein CpaB n=1 Tax=Arthrobacter oryzae TaxID=409290 RepID=UPI00273BF226|nr:RcpC/CpaB family pilus assembly protein [Arthrobacter oryzae]WLQ06863.1 flagellar biosynthesis protein FlgA [Arthrobacter oryzae]
MAGSAAVLLGIIGVILVFSYAQGADRRALEGLKPVDVLVVQKAVPAGTPVEALRESLALKPMPADAVPGSALKNLETAAGKVTGADLVAGEQLVAERLVDPAELQTPGSVPVPAGLQEVSFALDPQRTVGARLVAGDTAGVFISFGDGPQDPKVAEAHPETTQFVFHRVLITGIQRTAVPTQEETTDTPALPTGTIMVTVAVDDAAASRIVFGAEFGTIWLSKEPSDATQGAPEVIRKSRIYK